MYILVLNTHLLPYIDKIFLLFLVVLYSYIFLAHILHQLVFFLRDIFLLPIHSAHSLSFCLGSFHIFLSFALHDIILVLFLYILLGVILSIILLILSLYCFFCNSLLILFLPLYVDLDVNADVLTYLSCFLVFHHIFFSTYILFFYIH